MELRKQIEEIQLNNYMTEEKFLGLQSEQETQKFNYGNRELVKNGLREDMLKLPFTSYPLLSEDKGFFTSELGYDFVEQIFFAGRLTGSFMRANLLVQRAVGPPSARDMQESESDFQYEDTDQQINQKLNMNESVDGVMSWTLNNYSFDIKVKKYLDSIVNSNKDFKIRVYVLSCQNLAAIDSFVEFTNALAGDQALCSANPYLKLKLGEGLNNKNNSLRKFYDERENAIVKDLNPQFFKTFELDARFPDDWRLEIEVYDRALFSFNDTLIGKTVIDLEQRRYGFIYNQAKSIISINKEELDQQIKLEQSTLAKINKNNPQFKKKRMLIENLKVKLQELQQAENCLKNNEMPLEPVEFRELRHPDKKQAQGVIQMWCEVLSYEEARQLPMVKLTSGIKQEDYEVRLIIWETREVTLADGDKVDIYIKALFYSENLSTNTVEKQTDIHYNSKDGRGVFNYRMKFNLTMPAEFPQIKLQLYDYNNLSGDECLGETMLNIRNTVMLLQKNGKVDLKKVWASFNNPQNPADTTGYVLISIQLLTLADAEANPVGEAQDEPNEDPKLIKPTEGRGYGEAIQSFGFKLPTITLPSFDFWRKIMIMFGIIVGLGIVGFLMYYFKK